MDFEIQHTPEQEAFRREVQAWLKANLPSDLEPMAEPDRLSPEQVEFGQAFRRELGAKGWLAPTFPAEYGGGGLDGPLASVLGEELARYPYPKVYDLGLSFCAPAVMVWGTDEQKQRILPPILRGEVLSWQLFSEPEAGSDLASLQTRAIRHGDEYVINGTKLWVGSRDPVDFLYMLAVTDPSAPRHNNLGAFYIPANLPGITITPLDLVCHYKNMVYFDDVHVPASCLIGDETAGWRVGQTTLEVEHGGGGGNPNWGGLVYRLIEYCRETQRDGQALIESPEVGQTVADLYVRAQIGRLLSMRNGWMRSARVPWTYEGSQLSLYGKLYEPELARIMLELAGPYAMASDSHWAPSRGQFEVFQRYSLHTHGGGTPEIQRLIMARRMGIGKHAEAAARIA